MKAARLMLCWHHAVLEERFDRGNFGAGYSMSVLQTQPSTAVPSHPEEIKSTFELRVGDYITLQTSARITPAGVICTGIAVAAVVLSLGFLASSARQRGR